MDRGTSASSLPRACRAVSAMTSSDLALLQGNVPSQAELRKENSVLSARVGELEARVAEAEAGLAVAHTRFRFASSSAQRGESPTARSRGRSVQERVLDAQLGAVRLRSPAPALHARQAMREHLGRELPDRDPPELLHVYAQSLPPQRGACTSSDVVPPRVWL